MKARTDKIVFGLIPAMIIASLLFLAACQKTKDEAAKYHCPMHPTYISDRPGDCPICGMRLVPIEEKTPIPTAYKYQCPMHPEVKSNNPDDRCPKCGMKLEPIPTAAPGAPAPTPSPSSEQNHSHESPMEGMKEPSAEPTAAPVSPPPNQSGEAAQHEILFYRNPMDPTITSPVPAKDSMGMDYVPVYADEMRLPASGIEGLAPVILNEESALLSGVQVAEATRETITYDVRTVGSVKADETRIRHVHTKIMGYIEKLFVNFTGQTVQAGRPILTIYSPELLASQQEYLRALEFSKRFQQSSIPEVRRGGQDLVEAARQRLLLFDTPPNFLNEIEKTGKSQRSVVMNAPVSGFVTSKNAYEGHQVEPGMELFSITDLSRVWIEADFYEFEARSIKIGQKASVLFPYDPTMRLEGTVSYIYPYLNPESRTLKVRFDFPNANLSLKPSMYADITLEAQAGDGVIVPDSAVMDTGLRQIVFVKQTNETLTPREVKVGVKSGGKAQILSGLQEGEKVVVKANFLIDSESRLRAALSGMK
ncbi:MAG: efflux RND transporter periplasmic adaptor subunit [Candidatus Omnitrophota bacterium]